MFSTAASVVFLVTTFVTLGFFIYALKKADHQSFAARAAFFFIAFWLFAHTALSLGGFYQVINVAPPRIFVLGAMPFFFAILVAFLFARRTLIEPLPLGALTLLHVVRIPVEIVLFQLFDEGAIPVRMTFEGHNFDILSGITAPLVYFFAFRNSKPNKALLLIWNLGALTLLLIVVITSVLAFPSPWQQIAFAQPNIAVAYFPFTYLPAIVVPIVLFAHLASLYKLISGRGI